MLIVIREIALTALCLWGVCSILLHNAAFNILLLGQGVSKCHPVPDPDRHLQVLASSSSTHICLPRHSVNTFVSFFFRGRGLAELTLKYITLDKRAERLRSSRGWFSRELGPVSCQNQGYKGREGPRTTSDTDAASPALPPTSPGLRRRCWGFGHGLAHFSSSWFCSLPAFRQCPYQDRGYR